MLTNKWLNKTLAGLVVAIATIAATATNALAADGPLEPYVVVVHVTDGNDGLPAGQGSFARPSTDRLWVISPDNIAGAVYFDENGFAGAGDVGPGMAGPEQVEYGNTAVGLQTARNSCGEYPSSACHIILVNHQQPTDRTHRIAAKAAADELTAAGYQLYSVAVGQASQAHLGFNWYLTGQAFSATADEAAGLIDSIASNIGWAYQGETALPQNWDELRRIEKIWLNPHGCDLRTQWLWAYDGSCHDKMPDRPPAPQPPPAVTVEVTESTVKATAAEAGKWRYFTSTNQDDPPECSGMHNWESEAEATGAGFGQSAEVSFEQLTDAKWICFRVHFSDGETAYSRLRLPQAA